MSGTALATQRVIPSSSSAMSAGLPRPKSVSSSRFVPISRSIPAADAVRHRGQRMVGQEDTVDDRQERERDHPRVRTPPPHLLGRRDELGGRDALQRLPVHDAIPEDGRQSLRRTLRLLEGVHVRPAALHDGAPEEARGGRRAEQRRHAEPSGGLTEDRDVARIAAEGRDVVAHPPQRGQLVLDAPVPDQPRPGSARSRWPRKPRAPSR